MRLTAVVAVFFGLMMGPLDQTIRGLQLASGAPAGD
jgi:hypothetical protein